MLWQIIAILAFGSLLSVVVLLASKNGSKAAQLESIKAELRKIAEEQRRAREVSERVSSFSDDEVRAKLHEIANKGRAK